MPMDAGYHRQAEQGVGQQGTQRGARGRRHKAAAQAGHEERALRIIVIDAGERPIRGIEKPEPVAACDGAKRRNMELLFGHQLAPLGQGSSIDLREEVKMALAKGIVDFGNDRNEYAICAMAEPKTHRFECVAEHPWKGMQPDGSVGTDPGV